MGGDFSMSEQHLWNRLRNNLAYRGHFTRIESPISPGIPDVNYLFTNGAEGWIELKFKEPPARKTTAIFKYKGLRPEQIAEIGRRVKLNGRVWVLAGVGRTLYLVHGLHAPVFNGLDLQELIELSTWSAGPAIGEADWRALCIHLGRGK